MHQKYVIYNFVTYPTGKKISLECKFPYFTNGKFAKFKFRLSLSFQNINLSQIAKLNSMYIFILYGTVKFENI